MELTDKRKPKRLPDFLTEAEIDLLINGIDNLRDKTIIEVMISTGVRPRELRTIKVSDIDFSTGEIRVFGKNGNSGFYTKPRVVFLTQRALDLVNQYLPTRQAKWGAKDILFLNEQGKGIETKELNNMVKRHISDILHREITRKNASYILRHSFATILMNREVGFVFISELLGHKNFTSTQVYTHVDWTRLKKVYDECHPRAKGEEECIVA